MAALHIRAGCCPTVYWLEDCSAQSTWACLQAAWHWTRWEPVEWIAKSIGLQFWTRREPVEWMAKNLGLQWGRVWALSKAKKNYAGSENHSSHRLRFREAALALSTVKLLYQRTKKGPVREVQQRYGRLAHVWHEKELGKWDYTELRG